jgi:DNA-directed RNA polymerase specialized sigma24 family protein
MPESDTAVVLPLSPAEFSTLVQQYEGALYGFLCGLVGNTDQARDLAQDVFQDAWRVVRRSETPFIKGTAQEVMRRWLFQATYHRAISALRRRAHTATCAYCQMQRATYNRMMSPCAVIMAHRRRLYFHRRIVCHPPMRSSAQN